MIPGKKFLLATCACALALVLLPFGAAHTAAGGEITGTVTDPNGAVVAGATVTVADAAGKQSLATTDAGGRFKIAGLPAGVYTVTVAARGFTESRRENVAVEDGKSAGVDVRLQVADVGASVTVSSTGLKPNADPVYGQLRQQAKNVPDFAGATVASVNNLVLRRDAATFTLRSGEVYFLHPVEGRTTGAVFIGDGEMTLTPPVENERQALAIFTKEPTLTEGFTHLALRFTDKTFDEIKGSPNASMKQGGAQAGRARDIYADKQSLLRKSFRYNIDLRTLADLYSPERPGYFAAFVNGRRYEKLLFQLDPLGVSPLTPEEVALMSYGETDGGFWTSFHLADEYQKGTALSSEDNRLYDILRHEIDGAIKGTQIAASDRVTLKTLTPGVRVVPFDLFRSLRVSRVQDEEGRDLHFVQESKDEDADFAVILPQAMEAGKTYKLLVQYQGGDALRDSGGGNFILGPRSTWYPNNGSAQFGDRATFEMTFRYPKGYTFV
ncbi:MAG: carboxypeptidase regulatory-like domain-containing protein, partial [Pyrinomonadaceae bacterium]